MEAAALDGQVVLAAVLGNLDQLARHRDPIVQPLRLPDREVAGEQGCGERALVAGLARQLDGLRGELLASLARDEVDRKAEPGEQPGAQSEVVLADAGQRLLDERDDVLVDRADLRALDDAERGPG